MSSRACRAYSRRHNGKKLQPVHTANHSTFRCRRWTLGVPPWGLTKIPDASRDLYARATSTAHQELLCCSLLGGNWCTFLGHSSPDRCRHTHQGLSPVCDQLALMVWNNREANTSCSLDTYKWDPVQALAFAAYFDRGLICEYQNHSRPRGLDD